MVRQTESDGSLKEPPSRDEIFWKEADARGRLHDALSLGAPLSELHELKLQWWEAVEATFAYLVSASVREAPLQAVDFEFFAVMQGLSGDISAGRLPDVFSIASRQGDPASSAERQDIGNAVLYLLAADDPVSPVANIKPRKMVAERFGVSTKTVSNWKAKSDYYLKNRSAGTETLRENWLSIIRAMKASGRNYKANKAGGKRKRREGKGAN